MVARSDVTDSEKYRIDNMRHWKIFLTNVYWVTTLYQPSFWGYRYIS